MPARKKAEAQEDPAAEAAEAQPAAEEAAPESAVEMTAAPEPRTTVEELLAELPPSRTATEILADFTQQGRPNSHGYCVGLYAAVAQYVCNQMPDKGDAKRLALELLSQSMSHALATTGAGQSTVAT